MKNELNFKNKIKLLIRFLKWVNNKENYGLIASCSICNSTNIKRIDSDTQLEGDNVIYTAIYKCLSCNSVASAKEVWNQGGLVNEKC